MEAASSSSVHLNPKAIHSTHDTVLEFLQPCILEILFLSAGNLFVVK
jgi:hypothetical protein